MMQIINLFPAFEGPEGQNLHTEGMDCPCKPFVNLINHDGVISGDIRHCPLTYENKQNPPTWLPATRFRRDKTVKV